MQPPPTLEQLYLCLASASHRQDKTAGNCHGQLSQANVCTAVTLKPQLASQGNLYFLRKGNKQDTVIKEKHMFICNLTPLHSKRPKLYTIQNTCFHMQFNPTALKKKAKNEYNLGLFECNRVKSSKISGPGCSRHR